MSRYDSIDYDTPLVATENAIPSAITKRLVDNNSFLLNHRFHSQNLNWHLGVTNQSTLGEDRISSIQGQWGYGLYDDTYELGFDTGVIGYQVSTPPWRPMCIRLPIPSFTLLGPALRFSVVIAASIQDAPIDAWVELRGRPGYVYNSDVVARRFNYVGGFTPTVMNPDHANYGTLDGIGYYRIYLTIPVGELQFNNRELLLYLRSQYQTDEFGPVVTETIPVTSIDDRIQFWTNLVPDEAPDVIGTQLGKCHGVIALGQISSTGPETKEIPYYVVQSRARYINSSSGSINAYKDTNSRLGFVVWPEVESNATDNPARLGYEGILKLPDPNPLLPARNPAPFYKIGSAHIHSINYWVDPVEYL